MNKCILCGNTLDDSTHLFVCHNMPASAQDMPTQDDLDKEHGIDLQLCQCSGCGLIQFDCEPVSYYRDVIRAGGYSTTMKALRRRQYSRLIELCGLEGKKIIEIGCGQGEFLETLSEFPVKVYGIEHKADLVEKAKAKGLNVRLDFAERSGQHLEGAPFDAFLSFNFLEHQPDPNGMMRCIYDNLTDGGYGLITVPRWEYILANNSFYELLHDHIANYTEEALTFLLNKNGFTVVEREVVNDDTTSFIVRKRLKTDISGLKGNFDRLASQMKEFVNSRYEKGQKVAVWGASHQGFTAISTSGIGERLSYIIDSAPFKHGKYSPASHVRIVPPDHFFSEPVDTILIIAPAFTDEIAGIIRERFGEGIEIAAIRTDSIEYSV